MNITKLISPIQLHRDKEVLCVRQVANDMEDTLDTHTPISTPNQLPHMERSYFKHIQSFQKQNQAHDNSSYSIEQQSKFIDIDNKLSEIDKMKHKFANKRKMDSQHSLQRVGNRSIDRHHLKPSPAPKISTQTSQFSTDQPCLKVNEKNEKEQAFSFKMQKPQIINVDHHQLFQDSHFQEMIPTKRKLSNQRQSSTNCKCQKQFQTCMMVIKNQIQQLFDRTTHLQKSNKQFKLKQDKSSNLHQNFIKNIKNKENKQLDTNQNSIKNDNKLAELESSLKIATFRQRQPFRESSKTYELNERGQIQRIDKMSSRAKVQALLQRLQLRIQKS